jgi:hypothetical protein
MFSIQQSICANNIRQKFLQTRIRYALLRALCQAGKTGAFHRLIRTMFENGDITHAYIICGSNELTLRQQAEDDARKYNPEYYRTREHERQDEEQTIQVFFRQDFKTANNFCIRNALIICDETHLVQRIDQEFAAFLRRFNISMDGNPEALNANNCYLVSVDATPYSEIASIAHKETPFEKIVVELEPGEGYVGTEYYYSTNKQMMPTFSLTSLENRRKFVDLVHQTRCPTPNRNTYVMMRLNTSRANHETERHIRNLAAENGWDVLQYTSESRDIAITRKEQQELNAKTRRVIPYTCMEDEPTRPTIIIVRGRLRAGKVVPKYYVNFVWEGARMSNTDAVVQGLLGRMCGYRNRAGQDQDIDVTKLRADYLPLIFVPESSLKIDTKKEISACEIQRSFMNPILMPRKGTCLSRGTIANKTEHGKTQSPPIRLMWPNHNPADQDRDWLPFQNEDATDDVIRGECMQLLRRPENIAIIADHPTITEEQKDEIIERIRAPMTEDDTLRHNVCIRKCKSGSSQTAVDYYKKTCESFSKNTTNTERANENGTPFTFIVTFSRFRGLLMSGTNIRHLYVIFYTDAKRDIGMSSVDLKARIPSTTKKCMFRLNVAVQRNPHEQLVAAGVVGLRADNISTPESFAASMREYMTMWQASPLTMSSSIGSTHSKDGNKFEFSKAQFHWTSKHENDVERICLNQLAQEFNVRFNPVKYASGRPSPTKFNIKMISWERRA